MACAAAQQAAVTSPWHEIEPWDHGIPDAVVPAPYRLKVRAELYQALCRSYEVMGLPRPPVPPPRPRRRRAQVRTYRRVRGQCAGCGCHLDWATPGCRNCQARHYMRRSQGKPYSIRAELPVYRGTLAVHTQLV